MNDLQTLYLLFAKKQNDKIFLINVQQNRGAMKPSERRTILLHDFEEASRKMQGGNL